MKRRKTELLIRDIAHLIIRYSSDDWAPVLKELEEGGVARQKLSAAILEVLEETHSRPKRRTKQQKRTTKKSLVARAARSPFGQQAAAIINNKQVVPTLSHVRELALHVGMKAALPPSRDKAAAALLDYIESMPDNHRQSVLNLLQKIGSQQRNDAAKDYQRWFSMILSNPVDRTARS